MKKLSKLAKMAKPKKKKVSDSAEEERLKKLREKQAAEIQSKVVTTRSKKRKELRDEKKSSKLGKVMSAKNKIAEEKAIVFGTIKPTPANIRKFAGLKGKAAAIERYGKEAVDNVISIGSKKKIGTPPSSGGYGGGLGSNYPTGIPMTGKVGGAGGLKRRKSGGKIVKAKNGTKGGILGRLASMAKPVKKGIKRVVTDIKPLPGRTITGKRKTLSKRDNPEVKSGIAKREDSIQLKDGTIKTVPKGYKLKNGEKIVSIAKKTRGKTVPGTNIKGGTIQSSTVQSQKNRDFQVTKRNLRRFGTRAAAIAAGAYTLKKIGDAVMKKPPMAATDTSSSGGSHTVKGGQTLSQIAKDNGTTLKALLAANPSIKNANKIKVGQKIKLSKPVKKRKSVYQGISKAGMKKMAMPKKKKMGGGKVYRRGGGKALRGFGNATYSNKMY